MVNYEGKDFLSNEEFIMGSRRIDKSKVGWTDHGIGQSGDILSANQALEIQMNHNEKAVKEDLIKISKEINKICSSGVESRYAIFYQVFSKATISRLENLGYTVSSFSDQRDGPSTTVSW